MNIIGDAIPEEIIKAATDLRRWGAGTFRGRDWHVMGIGPREAIIDKFKCLRCGDVHVCRPSDDK